MNESINPQPRGNENIASVDYPEITLPSGKRVSFRQITFRDRRMVTKNYDEKCGYLLEDLLAAYALEKEDGAPVLADYQCPNGEYVLRMDHWTNQDSSYYLMVFLDTVLLDDTLRDQARETAKKLNGIGIQQRPQATGTVPSRPRNLKVE